MSIHQEVAGRKGLEAEVGAAGRNKTVLLCTQKAFNICTKEGDEGMQCEAMVAAFSAAAAAAAGGEEPG